MATMRDKSVTEREANFLKGTRRQLNVVRTARRRCNEIVSAHGTVKTVRFDGMPAGRKLPCGFDGDAGHAETLLQILQREETELKRRRTTAMRIIQRLPEALYCFCLYYYIEGMTVKQVAQMMDRTESSCWRYKLIIERTEKLQNAGGNPEEMGESKGGSP